MNQKSFQTNGTRPSREGRALLPLLLIAAAVSEQPLPTAAETPASLRTVYEAPSPAQGARGEGAPTAWVRPGYKLSLVRGGIGNCRFLELDDAGNLYVSQPERRTVLRLPKATAGAFGPATAFLEGKPTVHGLHWVPDAGAAAKPGSGWLWYTQSGVVGKARPGQPAADGSVKAAEDVTVIPKGQLPDGGGHWMRSIFVTSDGFFTSIGDAGNIQDDPDSDRQKIWRYNLDGSGKRLWARGIRNTEKLRYRPGTTELYGCDHGSDNFGGKLGEQTGKQQPITDFNPPDELNHYVEGAFYGHPFITGDRVPRIEFQGRPDLIELAAQTVPPAWKFGAHWATNGFAFAPAQAFAKESMRAYVACHGSWNRKQPDGYRIEQVEFDPVTGKPCGAFPLVFGLSEKNEPLLRPVDCVVETSGSVLFSCDRSNAVYRLEQQ